MGNRLEGKVAVVTGGGNGLGRCVSLDLAKEAAKVVVADLEAESASAVVEEITKSHGTAVATTGDVSLFNDCKNIIDSAITNFGRIDILVCCAGMCVMKGIEETTEEEWDTTMAVHLKGHFGCIHHAVPHMIKQKAGRIITFSSRGGLGYGGPAITAYSAAKAGILGLTVSLAKELNKHGITVNSILPSAITRLFPWERKSKLGDGIPITGFAGPEMVSPTVVYLALDEASYINGQQISVAGGNIALFPSRPKPVSLLIKKDTWTLDDLIELMPETLEVNMDNPAPPTG